MKNKKTKILVLTSSFPRFKNDWWQQAILSIYSNMDLRKYDITVIAPSSFGAKRSENLNGIKVRRFNYFYPTKWQLLTSGEGILYTSKNMKLMGQVQIIAFIFAELFAVISTLTKERYDIIHANWILPQGFIAVIAKFIFRKPVIVTVHGTDIFTINRLNFIKVFILKFVDYCTTNSSATFEAAYEIYPSEKIKVISMGTEIKLFDPKKRNKDWRKQFGNNVKIVLGVGRFIKWKGFEYLIRALPLILTKIPNAKLVLLGKGPEEDDLKRIALKLNLKIGEDIFFPGTFGPDMMPTIYASSDVVVSPSITNVVTGEKEGQGNVVLEARASGTSVVASRSGGLVDTVDGVTNGLLFEEKNYQELAEKIIYIFSNEDGRKKLASNGLKYVRKNFPWRKTSQKFEELYEKLV